jgi:hypothetical protein
MSMTAGTNLAVCLCLQLRVSLHAAANCIGVRRETNRECHQDGRLERSLIPSFPAVALP